VLENKVDQSIQPGSRDEQVEAVNKRAGCAQVKLDHHSNHIDVIDRLLIFLASFFLLLTIVTQCRILLQ